MVLDIKTLIVANAVLAVFMAFALLFYRSNYKTYSGFGFWLASIFSMAFVYVSILLRAAIPELLGILLTNSALILAVVLRLDGTVRFVHSKKISKGNYFLPVLILPAVGYFYLIRNEIATRNLFSASLLIIICCIIAFKLYCNRKQGNKHLYLAGSALFVINSLLIFGRAIFWYLNPQESILIAGYMHQIFFLLVSVFEVGTGIFFFMMNNQRLEEELLKVGNNLKESVVELEKALTEVKTLSGIIPICMHCKEIRDDQGYWNKLEKFIAERSDAKFSHGICDKCMDKFYPEENMLQPEQ